MQVREWLISKSFFTIKSTFFYIQTGEHTYFTSSSIRWLFHFFLKAASTCRSHSRRFFALSAPRRCMWSAAVVERHTPPRTMLMKHIPLIRGKIHREIHRCVYIYGSCAHEQHVRITLTLTLTHMITAYSVSGNVVHIYIHICVFLYGFFPLINGM